MSVSACIAFVLLFFSFSFSFLCGVLFLLFSDWLVGCILRNGCLGLSDLSFSCLVFVGFVFGLFVESADLFETFWLDSVDCFRNLQYAIRCSVDLKSFDVIVVAFQDNIELGYMMSDGSADNNLDNYLSWDISSI